MNDTVRNGTTNTTKGSVQEATYGCELIWTWAHEFSLQRMSESAEGGDYQLLDCYHTRARRIAATYARFYLEQEQGSDPTKKGRFYWMALGAFASKTVACLLDTWQVKGSFMGGDIISSDDLMVISEGLGLGNLWLFLDVATWHWAYVNHPDHYFKGMHCEPQRDAQKLLDNANGTGAKTTITKELEWAAYALPKVNDLKSTEHIRKGMELVETVEQTKVKEERQAAQMEHLKAIANHEQLAILQKLIYNHPTFAKMIKLQREGFFNTRVERWLSQLFSPAYELVFAAACEVDNAELKSVAPDGLRLEDAGTLDDAEQDSPKTRMGWIGQAAEKFHNLMTSDLMLPYMEQQIGVIASWVAEPDFSERCISVYNVSGAFK